MARVPKRVSSSTKSGLVFPVGRVGRLLRMKFGKGRIGSGAPVYLSAVLEYLCAEMLELAGYAAKDEKRTRITPRNIFFAVEHDEELHNLMGGVVIPHSGVVPTLPKELMTGRIPDGIRFVFQSKKRATVNKTS